MNTSKLPYLTGEIEGIGGKIKVYPEDFKVSEIPLYSLSGKGEHLYLKILKREISTFDVIQKLANYLKISEKDIGYAGIKDTHSLAIQYFSVPAKYKQELEKIDIPKITLLSMEYHYNKLKVGHLKGNQFEILIRDHNTRKEINIDKILNILKKKGVPNYFGHQRFGNKLNSDRIGYAILHNKIKEVWEEILENSDENESSLIKKVKKLIKEKNYKKAYKLIPSYFITEKRIVKYLSKGLSIEEAFTKVPKSMKKFYISAYQSALFNRTLAKRIKSIDEVWYGDLAVKHPKKTVFMVQEPQKEQERCKNFEISPSGPIFGYKMIEPEGKQREIELDILKEEKLSKEIFKNFKIKGERRTYRFKLESINYKIVDNGVLIKFALPKGCYATIVLRELMKTDF